LPGDVDQHVYYAHALCAVQGNRLIHLKKEEPLPQRNSNARKYDVPHRILLKPKDVLLIGLTLASVVNLGVHVRFRAGGHQDDGTPAFVTWISPPDHPLADAVFRGAGLRLSTSTGTGIWLGRGPFLTVTIVGVHFADGEYDGIPMMFLRDAEARVHSREFAEAIMGTFDAAD
jgi:hypothetical protein